MNSQVMKCLGFCAADFWSSVAYESAETQTQTNSNLRLPLSSVMSLVKRLFECPIPDSLRVLEAAMVTLPVAPPVDDAAVHPDLVGVLLEGRNLFIGQENL